MSDLKDLIESVLEGEESKTVGLVRLALHQARSPKEVLNEGLIKAMHIVGEKFKEGELFVPDVLWAAQAMKAGIEVLRPYFGKADMEPLAKVVIGTVKGDIHEIGKNLVAMMMEAHGFEVIDLGVDVAPEKFVKAAKVHNASLCMMSALLTTTMPGMKKTIEALETEGLADRVKTVVGGAPVTKEFALAIGADGYSPDASGAVSLAKSLVNQADQEGK